MTARTRMNKGGFTLVEILIVVVILGILAAIVIPQFTSASETAKASSLTSTLQTIRSQLQLYQVQHNGNYPDMSAVPSGGTSVWDQLTKKTDVDGALSDTGKFGPYLQKAPNNPFVGGANSTKVQIVTTSGEEMTGDATSNGWVYNVTTGEIKALVPDSVDWEELGLSGPDVAGAPEVIEE